MGERVRSGHSHRFEWYSLSFEGKKPLNEIVFE